MRVVVTHNPEDLAAYYGRALPELEEMVEVVRNPLDRDLSTAELCELASDGAVIVAHRSTPGPPALFEALPDLVAFLRCAVDISTIDVDAASRAGVLIARADKSFVASTAELALGLALAAARGIGASTTDYQRGDEPPQRPGRQLAGSTAGLIGFGDIARHLAGLLRAAGMTVIAHDPAMTDPDDGIEMVALDDLLARAHVVFPLVPGGPATTGLIGRRELALTAPGTILVNVSRGEVLDEEAVAEAYDRGHLGGLAMDVGRAADQRPSPALAARPGVVATPHLGGLTPQNADAQARSTVEQVRAMLEGEMPPRAVNPDAAHRLRAYWNRVGIDPGSPR